MEKRAQSIRKKEVGKGHWREEKELAVDFSILTRINLIFLFLKNKTL